MDGDQNTSRAQGVGLPAFSPLPSALRVPSALLVALVVLFSATNATAQAVGVICEAGACWAP